jgi:hypothetical protein
MSLKDFIDKKEEKQLDEGIASVIGTILGFATATLAIAFGGTLLVYGGTKAIKKMVDLWGKILGHKPGKSAEQTLKEIEQLPEVKEMKIKVEEAKRKFANELKDVYTALGEKNTDGASNAYKVLDRNLRNNPEVTKAIIAEISKIYGPPLYVHSPGSEGYRTIKRVINLPTARAAAATAERAAIAAVKEATEKQTTEE